MSWTDVIDDGIFTILILGLALIWRVTGSNSDDE